MSLSAFLAQDETASNGSRWAGDRTQDQSIGISAHYHQTNWPSSCGCALVGCHCVICIEHLKIEVYLKIKWKCIRSFLFTSKLLVLYLKSDTLKIRSFHALLSATGVIRVSITFFFGWIMKAISHVIMSCLTCTRCGTN